MRIKRLQPTAGTRWPLESGRVSTRRGSAVERYPG